MGIESDQGESTRTGLSATSRAALWMIGSIISFTTIAIAAREASAELDTFEIMLYRSLMGVLIVLAFGWASGTLKTVGTSKWRLHLVRNFCHFTGQNLWFYAIATIPLSQVFALEFTTPIWALLLAPLVLGERITRIGLLASLVGFAGVLLVARPDAGSIEPGLVSAAGAAVGFALTALFTRRLTRTQSITAILLYLVVIQALLSIIFAGYDGDIAVPTSAAIPYLVVIAFGGLSAHFCLTRALSLAPAALVMPIDFARLPIIIIIGAWLYSEPFQSSVLLGGIIIFGANYLNLTRSPR